MKRAPGIEALLKKATSDATDLKAAYEESLAEKHVNDDLKVSIKNIFENLRSCLDYMAHDAFDTLCGDTPKPSKLYFPIRSTPTEFQQAIARDFPGLAVASKAVYDVLEARQPYIDPWLGQFNKLNNHNKHQDLVEQTRTESRQVTVSRGGGSVSWGQGVTFGGGVSVMGVPIDPRTQLPVPNTVARTEIVTWVDFRFREIDQSVLPFVDTSIANIKDMFSKLRVLI